MQITKLCQGNVFSVFTCRMMCFVIIVGSLSLLGCSTTKTAYVGSTGAYHSYYNKGLESSFVAPEASEIQKAGQSWEYSKPFKEVWDASLDVLSQYQGILAMDSSSSQQSMLVLKARENKRAPENRHRIATYGSFFEQWLWVAVIKKPDSDETEVAVAVFEPSTGNLRNNDGTAQLLFSQIQIQLYGPTLWRDKFVYEKQQQSGHETKVEGFQTATNEPYKYLVLEQMLGGWISKSMREELITVYSPEVTSWLDEIVDRLKKAADVPDLKTRVTIIPANGLNAFALPNGNIIVSSGLLDSLDTTGQVASVLAHELDHLIKHDTIVRLKTKQLGGMGAWGMRESLFIGDIVVDVISQLGGYGALGSAMWDLGRAAGRSLGEMGAQHLETALVSNFSAETELRADENGIKMLNKAGFDPEMNIAMLNTLRKFKDKALKKNELVMFNLINIKPGIDERIENLEEVLNEIKNK